MPEYSEEILDSNSISSTDKAGRPIPVTIPIALAPGIKVVYTTRLGGLSAGDYGNLNLGGKSGDEPEAVLSNRIALAEAVQARLSLVSQVHSGVAVDVDDSFVINTPFGFDVSGTHGETDTPHVIEADGQVTAQSGIALGMFAADCLPVLLGDPVTGIIGAAHCGHCYEVGDEIADQFIKRFPLTKTKTRFGGAGIDIAEAAMIDLAFAGVHQVVDSMPRVHAATQYLEEDPELAELCRTDGEGPAELAERIDNISHSMCTLENPLWYSHRRAALANKTHEGRLLALIVRD